MPDRRIECVIVFYEWSVKMRLHRFLCVSTIVMIGSATPLLAQDARDFGVGVGLSTLGPTLEGSYRISPMLRARGILATGFSYEDDEDFEGTETSIDLSVGGGALVADYHPTGGNWRVSGGVYFAGSSLEGRATASPGDSFEFNGEDFTEGEFRIKARSNNQVAPIAMVGYDFNFGRNWALSADLGAIFTNGARLRATGQVPDNDALTQELQDAIDADADVQSAIKDADDLNFYPYISLIGVYRF